MKKLLFIIAAALLFSCSSPEKKAQNLIKKYLKENINDAKSYESVLFSKLDSVFSYYWELPEYKNNKHHFDIYINLAEHAVSLDLKIANEYLDSAKSYQEKNRIIQENFQSEFIGWKMSHKFRSKNENGALFLENENFYFDVEFKNTYNTLNSLYYI
jgi:hypothetical protein